MVVKFQVYKKSSPNGKITIYLAKRDYIDYGTKVEPIEGVLALDPNYVQSRSVFLQLVLQFRFGREDGESMGYSFKKTFYLNTTQIYPPEYDITPSEIQRNLMSKLGNFAFAFKMEFPPLGSPSYCLQQGWADMGALMGVEYELMAHVGVNENDVHKRSTSRLSVRRMVECPKSFYRSSAPTAAITKGFFTCSGDITIRASLASPVYRPEEDIPVTVAISNQTTREVKRLKVKVLQQSQVPMFSVKEMKELTLFKTDDAIALPPGSSMERKVTLTVTPPAKPKCGEAYLEAKKRPEDKDVLAPSTMLDPKIDLGDIFGIYITYVVRVKAVFGALTGDVILDVPFTLAVER